jgi:site-specific recombinase XerD
LKDRTTPSSLERATPSSGRSDPARGLRCRSADPPAPPQALELCRAVDRWLSDGRAQGWSIRTLTDHRQNLARFAWWLEHQEEVVATLAALDPSRVRAFLAYLREPHPAGRFGSDHPGAKRAARPSSVATYYRDLRAFTNFCRAEGLLETDPLKNVKPPRVPNDQIVPLEREQIQALLDAARRGRAPERDGALILLLLDTGMRVSELCGLTVGDVDRGSGELTVLGKGNKKRLVYMGQSARRALWRYLETDRRMAASGDPLFVSHGGVQSGAGLQRSGVGRVISSLGKTAGISVVRVSPHSLRHAFAINFLRGGGSVLELQALLGHEDLAMVRKYVLFAQADLAQAHRAASPADRMKLK